MNTPFPVLYLRIKPAIMAPYAYRPVARSVMATPGRTGAPSCLRFGLKKKKREIEN